MNKEVVTITTKEFVKLFYKEKDNLLKMYFDNLKDTEVGLEIKSLNLVEEQMEKMQTIVDKVIIDTMYTILLGLDGCASIGDVQQEYEIYDENGCKLTNCGEIEEYAYEYFQESE